MRFNICNKKDEWFTPEYAITPILEYIKPNSIVWCPFDQKYSNYVKLLSKEGHTVINSHINDGEDFFNYFPKDHIEYIISNPPYSLKTEVFERLFNLKIPFAMLIGILGLFDNLKRFELFSNNQFEILYFNKRIKFISDEGLSKNSPPFSSAYVCSQFLPKLRIFKKIELREDKECF